MLRSHFELPSNSESIRFFRENAEKSFQRLCKWRSSERDHEDCGQRWNRVALKWISCRSLLLLHRNGSLHSQRLYHFYLSAMTLLAKRRRFAQCNSRHCSSSRNLRSLYHPMRSVFRTVTFKS